MFQKWSNFLIGESFTVSIQNIIYISLERKSDFNPFIKDIQLSIMENYTIFICALLPHTKVWEPWGPHHDQTTPPQETDRALPDNIGSSFSLCNLILSQLERRPPKKLDDDLEKKLIEDNLKKQNLKTTSKENWKQTNNKSI
jgi:hypothetical protein